MQFCFGLYIYIYIYICVCVCVCVCVCGMEPNIPALNFVIFSLKHFCSYGSKMYIQSFHHNNELIPEQHLNEHNPMFDLLHSNTTRHNPPDA